MLQAERKTNLQVNISVSTTRMLTRTLMYPNIDSVGLSRILLILYSKFCAPTTQPTVHQDQVDMPYDDTYPKGSGGISTSFLYTPQSRHMHRRRWNSYQMLSIGGICCYCWDECLRLKERIHSAIEHFIRVSSNEVERRTSPAALARTH